MGSKLERALAEADEVDRDPDMVVRDDVTVTRGHRRSRVLQVRLNDDEIAALEDRAERQGLPVSTVARSMILGQLRADSESVGPMDRISALHRLADLLAEDLLHGSGSEGLPVKSGRRPAKA